MIKHSFCIQENKTVRETAYIRKWPTLSPAQLARKLAYTWVPYHSFSVGHQSIVASYWWLIHPCAGLSNSITVETSLIAQILYIPTEKAMAPHSSTLAWKIPWMEEPGRLQSMGSLRVRHDWATSLLLFSFMHWRRKWQPTPVFLPGESQGWGSLVGCRLWGHTESDTTEAT